MALRGSIAAVRNVRKLLDEFRERGLDVIHVRHESLREDAAFLQQATAGTEIHPEVSPMPAETVIEKHFPNSFIETELLPHLKVRKITDLVICGMMSEMCVDTTVRAAFDLGFRCILVHDACAAADRAFAGDTVPAGQVHGAFMSALGAVFARLTGTDELISEKKSSSEK